MNAPGSVEMNPIDALEMDLKEGDSIRICNSKSEVPMKLKVSESLPRGMIFSPCFDQSLSPLVPYASAELSEQGVCRVHVKKEN